MKNSSNYLLAALLVLLASLTAYNMGLRAEYRSGRYKDPLRTYITLNFKNFTEVSVPAANLLHVKIVPGPFAVRVHPVAAEYVHVSQQGQRLLVTVAFPEHAEWLGWGDNVVISCPQLRAVSADAVYQLKNQPKIDNTTRGDYGVLVKGFRQDSLLLRPDRASRIELAGNRLSYLGAQAGTSPGSRATLQLNHDNYIAAADLTMAHQSQLLLTAIVIPQLRYHLADSATATLTGAALRQLAK